MAKAIFITTANIFDNSGNGGVRASKEHYDMLVSVFGAENVMAILFVHSKDAELLNSSKHASTNLIIYKRTEGNIKLLVAACFGCRVYMPWAEKKILKEISHFSADLIFMDFSVTGRLLKKMHSYKTICFYHNIESDYTLNKMKTDGIRYFSAYLVAKANDRWASKADYVMCFNERDSNRLKKLYRREADYIFPISLKDRFDNSKCQVSNEKRLLFLGSCFGPNKDGIEWFIREVMPVLTSEIPDLYLDIVGLGFEKNKARYEKSKNVNVIGSVDNTDEWYYSHPAVVMPIRYGAGMKVKTAEAMMFGRFIFATNEALEGYEVDGTEGIVRCNTAKEYANAIFQYFMSLAYCQKKYAKEVRELFIDKYEHEHIKEEFARCITKSFT